MDVTHHLRLAVDGPAAFEVRRFAVTEGLHELFRVELEILSPDMNVDLDALMGAEARFELRRHPEFAARSWQGLVTRAEHVGIDDAQLSTYQLVVEPELWLLTQRRNYRVFQQLSDPAIVLEVLGDWGIEPRIAYDASAYLGRKYRVQYAESDYAFICRLLEDAGITFFFEDTDGETRLVLSDAPQAAPPRPPLSWVVRPGGGPLLEIATDVEVRRRLRPGRYTQRDVDFRRSPEFPLVASEGIGGVEAQLERFHQNYGAFLYSAEPSGDTPVADDHGAARTSLDVAERQVRRRLAAKRVDARRVTFTTTAHDVAPGRVVRLSEHPRPELGDDVGLLVVRGRLEGERVHDWQHTVEACFAAQAYHPPLQTPKPRTLGLESATVVGPSDDEIHTDEFARVRVQFHWDREGRRDTRSSCWIPVNQPWGGAGFGALNIPRVGQEVIVDFLGEDPDRPVIAGRVYTETNPVPYSLPRHKTVSGLRSHSANQPQNLLRQAAKALANAGTEALGDAVGGPLGDLVSKVASQAVSAGFGEPMPPLGSLLPEAASMLAQLPNPGGVSFPTPGADTPPPPLTDGSPSRAIVPTLPEYPEGPFGKRVMEMAAGMAQNAASQAIASAMSRPSPAASPGGSGVRPDGSDGTSTGASASDGPRPAVPMGHDRMQAAMDNGFGAFSPSMETHRWTGSEVTMDDTLGSERLYMQAQRDMNALVKNNGSTIVGSTRSVKIGTSDVLDIGQNHVIRTGGHRAVDVRANQSHVVRGDINQASVEASQRFSAAEAHTTSSKALVFIAEERLSVDCGPPPPEPPAAWVISGLLMQRDHVMLDGPKLFLNPGPEALQQAMESGDPPEPGEETRAKAHDAAVAGARDVYESAWQSGDLPAPEYRRGVERQNVEAMEGFGPEARSQAWRDFMDAHPTRRTGGAFGTEEFVPPE